MNIEVYLFWLALTLYVASACLFIYSLFLDKEQFVSRAIHITTAGFLIHTVSLIWRWIEIGHGPYVSKYEVFSSTNWLAILIFLIAQWKWPKIKIAGAAFLPLSFILMGWAATVPKGAAEVPPSLKSYWLIIHIIFAKLAYGSVLVGTSMAFLYLLKDKKTKEKNLTPFLERTYSLEKLDYLSYRFIAMGFIFLAIVVISGAIWANNAWGRYWGWDPIETWALISWLIYGLYLHLRITWKWAGRKAAWTAMVAVFILIFSLFGVGVAYVSVHSGYLK